LLIGGTSIRSLIDAKIQLLEYLLDVLRDQAGHIAMGDDTPTSDIHLPADIKDISYS
jgi:hypothetical protein